MSGSKGKAARGAAWATGANLGCQLLGLLFSFALARVLDPRVFGLVAIAWNDTAFMQIFVTQGFGVAIVQRKDLEEEHLNSAFWIAIASALLFCLASILLAVPMARLFKEPKLAPVICWLSFSMVLNALSTIPTAVLSLLGDGCRRIPQSVRDRHKRTDGYRGERGDRVRRSGRHIGRYRSHCISRCPLGRSVIPSHFLDALRSQRRVWSSYYTIIVRIAPIWPGNVKGVVQGKP